VLLACTDLSYSHATATSVIHTLSLHDALPISFPDVNEYRGKLLEGIRDFSRRKENLEEKWLSFAPLISYHEMDLTDDESYRRMKDRKSTRLNSSHVKISYAVFCLKKTIAATT